MRIGGGQRLDCVILAIDYHLQIPREIAQRFSIAGQRPF